jgi:D-threo-aldose 1-dehydrogenase
LGNCGVEVPNVVFGSTSLGNLFVALNDSQKRELVRAWIASQGVPIAIDIAGKYGAGMALEILARELSAANIAPSDVIINNKLGWRRVPLVGSKQSFEPDAWFDLTHDAMLDMGYDGMWRCWEQGCQLLGKYAPALTAIHDPDEYLKEAADDADRERRLDEIVESHRALSDIKRQGLARAIGIAAKDWRCVAELTLRCEFDWVMLANSFTIMNHPPELIAMLDRLQSNGVGVINSALFQGGFVVGGDLYDYRKLTESPQDRSRLQWRDKFWKLCKQFAVTPFAAAAEFGRAHPAIQAIALSTSQPARVPEMVTAGAVKLDKRFWQAAFEQQLVEFMPQS